MSKEISRRRFLQIGGLATAASMLPMPMKWLGNGNAMAFYQSSGIPLFKSPLRVAELTICAPDGIAPITGAMHYTTNLNEYQDQLIPAGNGFGKTTLWGYDPSVTVQQVLSGKKPAQTHLGGLILAQRGGPISITMTNNLDKTYDGKALTKGIVPNDLTIPGANTAINRTCVHLHGGLVPWMSDGGPFDWFAPNGDHGLSFLNNTTFNPTAKPGQGEYYYPNDQSARFLWYHDHAFGITRINAYAGIASAYLLRDSFEANLVATAGLPPFVESSVVGGKEIQELPLVFQDKIFVGSNINLLDPSWKTVVSPSAAGAGSLWYPHLYEPNRWRKTYTTKPLPNPSVIAEMFGDTMLVNGLVYPDKAVQPRRYRLRMLNACNARFLNLQLYIADNSPEGITLDPLTGNPTNQPFLNAATGGKASVLQMANECGYLTAVAETATNVPFYTDATLNLLNPVGQGSLILGNAERNDLIVDFSLAAGKKVILYNDAPAPFPGGDPRNDYFPGLANGNPVNASTKPGKGPNTRVLMRFTVGTATTGVDAPLTLKAGTSFVAMPAVTRVPSPFYSVLGSIGVAAPLDSVGKVDPWNDDLIVPYNAAGVPDLTKIPAGVKVRRMTLNEDFDAWGRLRQMVGTDVLQPAGGYGMEYLAPTTEICQDGAIEIWQIANTTADTHPMHFHLVNVQILKRQPVDVTNPFTPRADDTVLDAFNFLGNARPADPYELGWKETCRMNPGEVITCIMKFALPVMTDPTGKLIDLTSVGGGVGVVPSSPRTGDHEYVFHCHILEHEEHDMMRPLVVKK